MDREKPQGRCPECQEAETASKPRAAMLIILKPDYQIAKAICALVRLRLQVRSRWIDNHLTVKGPAQEPVLVEQNSRVPKAVGHVLVPAYREIHHFFLEDAE